jgi:hypothetical protein
MSINSVDSANHASTAAAPKMIAGRQQVENMGGRNDGSSTLSKITCPHCWTRFAVADTLWVSQHAELLGDPVLGTDAASRFLPSRFSPTGDALDARGMACHTLACPACHLPLPRPCLEIDPLFVSIIGVPASGKSYFLTAMTWELRRTLASQFAVTFSDADTVTNRTLNEYEELLFLPGDVDRFVAIRKTEVHGTALYDQIRQGQQIVSLPRPFLFSFRPTANHPNAGLSAKVSRLLCLYDNAGEAFEPGEDTSASPVTQHLAQSRVLMFLYDPTQDARFRAKCRAVSSDPQLEGRSRRQETILLETAARVRRYSGLSAQQKHAKPMIVIVPKADVWGALIGLDLDREPVVPKAVGRGTMAGVDVGRVEQTSSAVRSLLLETAPEFVTAVEDFCEHVVYVPVSALGRGPERQDGQDGLFVRAGEIKPKWVTVPLLYALAKWTTGLIASSSVTPAGPAAPRG